MDDNDLIVNHEDEFDPEELDFNLDDAEEEDAPAEPVEPEKEPEVNAPVIEDDRISRLEADLAAAKAEAAQIAKEREEAWEEAEKVRTSSLQGAISAWQTQLTGLQNEMLSLQVAYDKAKIAQDEGKMDELFAKYQEKSQVVNKLTNDLNAAHQQLNQKPERKASTSVVEKKEEAPKRTPAQVMADQWVSENSWYNDPAHSEKRKLVDEVCKKAIEEKYNPASIKFWNYVDKKVEEAAAKKEAPRRTPPAVRPVATNQTGTQGMTNKKKADAEILAAAHRMLERRGITKTSPDFDRLQKSYYATVKRETERAKQNNG